MSAWAGIGDIRDKLIESFITHEEMDEGNKAVDSWLASMGITTTEITGRPDVLRDMAAAYACYRACLYASTAEDDVYAVKMKQYRDEYTQRQRNTTREAVTGAAATPTYGSIRVERG